MKEAPHVLVAACGVATSVDGTKQTSSTPLGCRLVAQAEHQGELLITRRMKALGPVRGALGAKSLAALMKKPQGMNRGAFLREIRHDVGLSNRARD